MSQKILKRGGLWMIVFCLLGSHATAQTVFKVKMPVKLSPPGQIETVKLNFGLETIPPVTITGANFTVTDPQGNSFALTGPFPMNDPNPIPTGAVAKDALTLSSPDPTNDSANYKRYEIDIQLRSNYNPQNCAKTITADEEYTITVTPVLSGGSTYKASGFCLESYDDRNPVGTCLRDPPTFVPGSMTDQAATLEADGVAQPLACFKTRPGLDAVLVLDRSGSMNTSTASSLCPGASACTRMGALRNAVNAFVTSWAGLEPRVTAAAADRVGVVLFNSDACFWQPLYPSTLPCPQTGPAPALQALSSVNVSTTFGTTNLANTMVAGGSTSIGDGLRKAAPLLSPDSSDPQRRKVILLMSDGQQNTDPMADASTGQVATKCLSNLTPCGGSSAPTALPNQPRIYTVTLGPQVSAAVNQQIAQASGGFYLNTEDTPKLLSPFFLELLQNVLKFNSYDTVRLVSKTTPYSTLIPISTTSHDAEFNLMWPSGFGPLRLTVTPPGGGQAIVKDGGLGFLSIIQPLPMPAPFDPVGDWRVQVEALGAAEGTVAAAPSGAGVPFDLHVMTDDGAIKSDLSVVHLDYKSGGKILLRAKLTQFGRPIVGLGTHNGETIMAVPIGPSRSIGDILSESTASPNPPSGNLDLQLGAEAKLFNTFQNDPSKLIRKEGSQIALFDDGRPEHGDDVAGDGIYSALFPAPLPGHYNFLFSVERLDTKTLRFSRQQLRTAYVRPVPDASNTTARSRILRRESGNVLSISLIPRGVAGDRMGPGWANFFWFTAPGVVPFKAVDNLNGSYTGTLAFAGAVAPPVTVHFEDVVAIIPDSTTPDKLPQPLGPENVLTDIPPPCCPGPSKIAVFLDAGAGIPHGALGSAFNAGFSLNAGLEYAATNHFSAEGIFGYHHFPGAGGSALDLYQFSVNGKAYLASSGPLRPFVNAGAGGYKFSPGSTYFGGNFGAGLLYELTAHWGLQASYDFHAINTPVTAKFSDIEFGVRYQF